MDPNTTNTGLSVPSSPPAGDQGNSTVTTQAQNPLSTPPIIPLNSQGPLPNSEQSTVGVAPGATNGIPQPSPSSVAAMAAPSTITGTQTIPSGVPPAMHKGKPMLWVIVLLIFAFLCGLLLAAWYFQTQLQKVSPSAQTAQAPVTTQKSMIIGIAPILEPTGSTASGGALVGYTIELGDQIGKASGATVEFKNIREDELFTALDNKDVDMIVSSIAVTSEMKQQYDFSENLFSEASTSAKQYHFVFRKGDQNVANMNEILSSLGTQGVLTNLKQKWLDY